MTRSIPSPKSSPSNQRETSLDTAEAENVIADAIPRAATRRGRDTTERILSATTEIFCEEGYGGLTMRRVASATGISLSNLQFHFRTREDLLSAIITEITDAYLEQYKRFGIDTSRTPTERLEAVLRHLISEDKKPRVQTIFFNIWALAQTQEFARLIVERTYSLQRAALVQFIKQINPKLSLRELTLRAALIACQAEGLMILIPQRKNFPCDLNGIELEAVRSMMAVASAPSSTHETVASDRKLSEAS